MCRLSCVVGLCFGGSYVFCWSGVVMILKMSLICVVLCVFSVMKILFSGFAARDFWFISHVSLFSVLGFSIVGFHLLSSPFSRFFACVMQALGFLHW